MEERLSRDEILKRLADQYQRLTDTFARLTPVQWTEPNVVGIWSAKDVMAHLIYWNRFPVQEVEAALKGSTFAHPEGSDDDINAQAVAPFHNWTPDAVRDTFKQSYAALLACIQALPENAFEANSPIEQRLDETVHGALANNTYEHWPIHEAQIRAWLER